MKSENTNVHLLTNLGIVIESPDKEIFVVTQEVLDEFVQTKWPNQKIKILATNVPILN